MPSLPCPIRLLVPVIVLGWSPAQAQEAGNLSGAARARARAVVRELERAAAGLTYVTEADFPVRVLHFPTRRGTPSAETVARAAGLAPGRRFAVTSVRELFRTSATAQPWHSPAEQESVRRFQVLVRLLETQLREVRVFRFGELEIDAYVVGVTSAGDWAGVAMRLVQT
jgi:hypothetical protein